MPQKKPGDPGLWDAIHAKRERIEKGSGETMLPPEKTKYPYWLGKEMENEGE